MLEAGKSRTRYGSTSENCGLSEKLKFVFRGYDEGDIEIKFTGLRPGEKMYEELLNEGEVKSKTSLSKDSYWNCRQFKN